VVVIVLRSMVTPVDFLVCTGFESHWSSNYKNKRKEKMAEESKPFDKQQWIDELSHLIASARVPPSTVYMGGEHNPRPSEVMKATRFVDDLLESMTNYMIEELNVN